MGLADYTAIVEAGNAVVDLLRDNLTPEPLGNRELIALCSPHESENNQLTLYLYHIEEENQNMTSGYLDQTTQRRRSSAVYAALSGDRTFQGAGAAPAG